MGLKLALPLHKQGALCWIFIIVGAKVNFIIKQNKFPKSQTAGAKKLDYNYRFESEIRIGVEDHFFVGVLGEEMEVLL